MRGLDSEIFCLFKGKNQLIEFNTVQTQQTLQLQLLEGPNFNKTTT